MSLYARFVAEVQTSSGWRTWVDEQARPSVHIPAALLDFALTPGSGSAAWLFEHGPLGMESTPPADAADSPAWRALSHDLPWYRPRWAPLDALNHDRWACDTLLLSASVPPDCAALFLDGAQLLPAEQLTARGVDVTRLLRGGDFVSLPVERRQGWCAPSRGQTPVEVTWRSTVLDIIGRRAGDGFSRLAGATVGEPVRIVRFLA